MAVSFDIVTMALHHLQLVPYPQSQPKSARYHTMRERLLIHLKQKYCGNLAAEWECLLKRIIEADRRALQFFLALIIYIRLVW